MTRLRTNTPVERVIQLVLLTQTIKKVRETSAQCNIKLEVLLEHMHTPCSSACGLDIMGTLQNQTSDCCSLGFLAASICDNLLIQNRLYLGNSLLSIRPKYRYNNTLPPFFDSFYVFSDFQRRTSDPSYLFLLLCAI